MKTLSHHSVCFILALIFGFSVIGCGLFSPQGTTTMEFMDSAVVSADRSASLELPNGAKIELWTEDENAGKAFQVKTSGEKISEKNKEKVVERIYTVDCQECIGSIQSTMTLPIETEGLSEEELLQYHLAYKDDDTWVTLPSTVDVENRTVSGSVGHLTQFALIRWLSGNSLPEVSMRISPNFYQAMSGDYPDASVEVFATDKDGDPLRVEVTVALKSFQTKLVSEMVEFYKNNMNIFEASCHNAFGLTGGPSCTILRTALDVLKAPGYDVEITYDLSEVRPGYYIIPAVPISALDESFLYSVEEMKVIVRVFEGDAKKPEIEREQAAPWISGFIRSPEPIHPGPSADVYCPVQPTFSWNPGVYESMRLRLVEGDDVWGAAFPAAQWTCHGVGEDVDCNGDNPPSEGVFSNDWTPKNKLIDGKTYSWGIVVSLKPDDNKFDPASSIRSDIYQFTVDSHILGNQCTPSKNAPTPVPSSGNAPAVTPTPTMMVESVLTDVPNTPLPSVEAHPFQPDDQILAPGFFAKYKLGDCKKFGASANGNPFFYSQCGNMEGVMEYSLSGDDPSSILHFSLIQTGVANGHEYSHESNLECNLSGTNWCPLVVSPEGFSTYSVDAWDNVDDYGEAHCPAYTMNLGGSETISIMGKSLETWVYSGETICHSIYTKVWNGSEHLTAKTDNKFLYKYYYDPVTGLMVKNVMNISVVGCNICSSHEDGYNSYELIDTNVNLGGN